MTAGAVPLQRDIPCARCGYDLRGLTPPGRCPECGYDVELSLRAVLAADQVPPPERRWLRQMTEATAVALLTFAISIAADFILPLNRAGARVVATSLLWGTSLYACWKMRRLEPLEISARGRGIVAACALLLPVAFVAFGGFLIWASGTNMNRPMISAIRVLLIPLAIAACAAFYLRVRHVALRLGAPDLAGQALVVAVLSPALGRFLHYGFHPGMLGISPTTGWAGGFAFVLWNIGGDWESFFYHAWPALLTLCHIAVLIQLLGVLTRARRRPAATAAAAEG